MKHQLPALPFAKDSLAPLMSAETLDTHHGKHHKGYVEKLNEMLEGSSLQNLPLKDVIRKSSGALFNQAAQHWNHSFFWHCLTPSPARPPETLRRAIERDFGSMDLFRDQFRRSGVEAFGSGWIWLLEEAHTHHLKIEVTHDAGTPVKEGKKALLTCDLWEHAYYLDYKNERARYIDAFFELVNWDFADRNLTTAMPWEGPA